MLCKHTHKKEKNENFLLKLSEAELSGRFPRMRKWSNLPRMIRFRLKNKWEMKAEEKVT